ncbi:hypothetical protein Hanom_Chr09g00838971 [Helianthus anomalus]
MSPPLISRVLRSRSALSLLPSFLPPSLFVAAVAPPLPSPDGVQREQGGVRVGLAARNRC